MHGWREQLLKDFEDPVPALSLVSDPDGFLQDSQIALALAERGIDAIEYSDPVAFRYVYEQRYRGRLARDFHKLLVRVDGPLDAIPYDVLQHGRTLEYRFSTIFPKLSASIVRELEPSDIDLLYAHYRQYTGSSSMADTCGFILERVYRVPYHLIDTKTEFFKFLLSKHYTKRHFAPAVQSFLVDSLKNRPDLVGLPVSDLVNSETRFFEYIQVEWPNYLTMKVENWRESNPGTDVYSSSGISHPFDDTDVRRLLDSLFIDGKLPKANGFNPEYLPKWTHVGLRASEEYYREERLRVLIDKIEEMSVGEVGHKQYMQIAALVGEAKNLLVSLKSSEEQVWGKKWLQVRRVLNARFQEWLLQRFDGLLSLSYIPQPVIVNHVPHYLNAAHQGRIVLIVLDGMSFAQWVQIRTDLEQKADYVFDENAVYAWIPSITSISRQALFSGEHPFSFSDSIQTTQKEERAWRLFWENQGIHRNHVCYKRGLGTGEYRRSEVFSSSVKIAGLVIDTIDKLMHRALQGHRSVHAELALWLQDNYLHRLIQDFLATGFSVYLTSDHGNCESVGIGRLNEGVLAQTKGERVRIYSDRRLRSRFQQEYDGIEWDGHGLPDSMFPLLARDGEAFVREGEAIVSHGGISIEEVLVPFVRVTVKQL